MKKNKNKTRNFPAHFYKVAEKLRKLATNGLR
jgi:hypothetical protein